MEDFIEKNKRYLDSVYPHTEYKIKYIKAYVEKWLEVAANYEKTKNINFIDCMCNAGIYANNILGTSTEVLLLFTKIAPSFPHIQFNLFVNDINENRVEIIKDVFKNYTQYEKIVNINIYFSNKDVNDYLDEIIQYDEKFNFDAQAFTLLFVDPYRFGDVKIISLNKFLAKYRSELIYNYFISDYRRNINNPSAENKQEMMINSMKCVEGYNKDVTADQLLKLLQINFVNKTKIKFTFAYPFRISTNTELYYIIYATPDIRGLELIKKCIWDVFNGNPNHRNPTSKQKRESSQMTLFTADYQKMSNVDTYSEEAKDRIINEFKGTERTYEEIKEYVISNTMLNASQIINNILKPLIKDKKVKKCNLKGNINYKDDNYIFLNI